MKESMLTTVVPVCLTTRSCFSSESSHIVAESILHFPGNECWRQEKNHFFRLFRFHRFFADFWLAKSRDERGLKSSKFFRESGALISAVKYFRKVISACHEKVRCLRRDGRLQSQRHFSARWRAHENESGSHRSIQASFLLWKATKEKFSQRHPITDMHEARFESPLQASLEHFLRVWVGVKALVGVNLNTGLRKGGRGVVAKGHKCVSRLGSEIALFRSRWKNQCNGDYTLETTVAVDTARCVDSAAM
jgi:hypothetical protein